MKRLIKGGLVIITILAFILGTGFTNYCLSAGAAATGGAKAAGAAAGEATAAGISTGTVAALTVAAAAIAAIAVAAGGEGGAVAVAPSVAEEFINQADSQTEASASSVIQTLDSQEIKALSDLTESLTWDQWSQFRDSLDKVTLSELQGWLKTLTLTEFQEFYNRLSDEKKALVREFISSLDSEEEFNKTKEFIGSIDKEEEFEATQEFLVSIEENYQSVVLEFLTQMHPGYSVTFTQQHKGGGEYVTVVHLTAIHH